MKMNSNQENSSLVFFLLLSFTLFIGFCTYTIPATFYPLVCQTYKVSESLMGFILATYPIGSFFSGLYAGEYMHKWKIKHSLIGVKILLALSFLCFGLCQYIANRNTFIVMSFISRLFQGVGMGLLYTLSMAHLPILFPETLIKKIGYLEITTALGIGLGPLIGSGLNYAGGTLMMYGGISGILLIETIITPFYYPHIELNHEEDKDHKFFKQIYNRDIIINFFAFVFSVWNITFLMPGIALRVKELGGTEIQTSILFVIMQLSYIIGCYSVGFYPDINYQTILIFAFGCNLVAFFLYYFDSLITLGIGFLISGFPQAMISIPNIPANIKSLEERFPNNNNSQLHSNLASGIFNAALAMGEFLGPIIGGGLGEELGFSNSILFLVLVFFGFLNILILKKLFFK